MQIIKLDAIGSTNAYLKEMAHAVDTADFTVVTAREQLRGRGQMGASWVSEPGKNLTFSVLKQFDGLAADRQYLLNIQVALSVFEALKELGIPDLAVKWPNDILSGKRKICGILVENLLKGPFIASSIIGIGLNVNQVDFGELPQVSSLQLATGNFYDLDMVLAVVLSKLELRLNDPAAWDSRVVAEYHGVLFRKDIPSPFETPDGARFMGIIQGVASNGKLQVLLEDDTVKEYGIKEVKLLY